MRPVNLLPERHRPRVATGGRSGSAYVLIGVLGLVLAGVAVYALVAKQVNDREAEAARISDEAAATEAEAAQLAPFGQFADLKAARLSAVAGVAASRIDWERLARELSLVLPARVWLTQVEASSTPGEASGTTATTTTTDPAAATGPSVSLTGCAPGQPSVATVLVRLRRLSGAVDVKLTDSTKVESEGGLTAGATAAPAAPTGGATEGGECPAGYSFQASVDLSPPPPEAEGVDGVQRVPASLGGGS